jgi:hypothetical protein
MINGMRQDHSWADPGQHYVNIYEYIAARNPYAPTVDTSANRKARSQCVDGQPEHAAARRERADTMREEVDTVPDRIHTKMAPMTVIPIAEWKCA